MLLEPCGGSQIPLPSFGRPWPYSGRRPRKVEGSPDVLHHITARPHLIHASRNRKTDQPARIKFESPLPGRPNTASLGAFGGRRLHRLQGASHRHAPLGSVGLLAWTTRQRGAKEIMDRTDESPDPRSRKVAEGAQPLDVGRARVLPPGSRSVAKPASQMAS